MPLQRKNTSMETTKQENVIYQENDYSLFEPLYSLKEVILEKRVYEDIDTAISFYKHKDKIMKQWGLFEVFKEKKNITINFYGASGTGKTMAAHAFAYEIGKKLLIINYAQIESKYVGDTSKNLEKIFKYAEEKNVVLFFDEADALLSKRVTNMSSSTDVSVNQTKSVLLNLLNTTSATIIFATNFISNYDVAFMRRILFHIKFDLPNEEMRKKIWEKYIPTQLPTDLDLNFISQKYENISGSDISNAVFLAVIKAVKDGCTIITQEYFFEAIEKIKQNKQENRGGEEIKIYSKEVSEKYVKEQLNEK